MVSTNANSSSESMDEPGVKTRPRGERATLVLATDLDGTFAGGTASDRHRLQRELREERGALLLYVTGRSVGATRELMAEADLPHPDVLIADVGTTVVRGDDFEPVEAVREFLERRWPGEEAVRGRLEGLSGISPQEVRPPRRVSYWLEAAELEDVLDRVRERVADLDVDVIGSASRYVDVLPGGVNKGSTLLRVLEWLERPRDLAVVAGDTLNDLALFETGLRGIVVGNAEPHLKRRAGGPDHVYMAEAEGAAGILEGLAHFESSSQTRW